MLALHAASITSLWLSEIESTFRIIRTELRSWQSLLTCLARDWSCCCFNGSLHILCHITVQPFVWRFRTALFSLHVDVLARAIAPIHGPEMRTGKRSSALPAPFAHLSECEAVLFVEGVVGIAVWLCATRHSYVPDATRLNKHWGELP